MLLFFLLGIVIVLYVIHVVFNYNKRARMLKKIPGPRDVFIVGNGLEIILSPADLFKIGRVFASKFPNLYRFYSFPFGAVIIYNPEDMETIMSNAKYNPKSSLYDFIRPWLGDGLLLSKGPKWQQRRRILTPAFHFNILKQFLVVLEENSKLLVDSLETMVGEQVDVTPVLSEFTLNSICETAMGTKLSKESAGKRYKQAIYDIGSIFITRFARVYLYWDTIFNLTSLSKKQEQILKVMHGFTNKVIKERTDYVKKNESYIIESLKTETDDVSMTSKRKKTAMLDLLILAEKDGLIDKKGIQEEVDTFMFEGHDTTASGLTFCLMLIANHKHIQEKIFEELYSIFGDSDRHSTMEDLAAMKYLECCIKESLRLYPPVSYISRNLTEEVKLSNYTIPADVFINISIYDLHRREDLFKNASVFDPDRFLPENSIGRHPYSFIPFSAGFRNCIGQKFAMMEMKSVLSALLRKYELRPVTTPADIVLLADLVLRNDGPVNVTFVKRMRNK